MPSNQSKSKFTNSRFAHLLDGSSDEDTKQVTLSDLFSPEELFSVIESVCDEGAALTISRTSDGGALSMTFWVGNQKSKRYYARRGEVDTLLAGLKLS